ncbi:hypothetical protein B0G81_8019 [Paraburkholderia sp. BL6665CI2N2]|uniref:aspartate-semialdehyde dehydrogenase n=1 Tax=Paraburkholderia sp. BL6665CI2N2 TaxID=1938806 RepID=UPI001066E675|nr:aspartate-semialdehyde dehydrogenase [Paraburkholderia sp. BL6665CI2N2]TDY16888.1 hypothetical protein B0G81_8019 [Paraburkholderia sp. BL6665CI2N2]
MSQTRFDAAIIADAVLAGCRGNGYAGDDPFDGLNSALFRTLRLHTFPFARVAWLQFHKRSPINFRRVVGVPQKRNPKGIALILLGMMEREKNQPCTDRLAEAVALGDWLLSERCDRTRWKHSAWGYHFDWAARAFFVPTGTPNAITTCYVARALYALGSATGERRFTEAAVDAGYFLDDLYKERGAKAYYGYIPGEDAFVHNASLWAAALVSETASRTGDYGLQRRSLRVARQSASMQRPDGAWLYGTRSHHAFVDGFHTGYNLEALRLIGMAHKTDEFAAVVEHGLSFYRRSFFLKDGTVKYYDAKVWPLDTHSVSQALITLLTVGETADDLRLAGAVLNRAIETLYLPAKTRFVYQRNRFTTNRINYLRWTQAWAFYSLALYASRATGEIESTHMKATSWRE